MTSRDFCYWLQGYFELGDKKEQASLSAGQVDCIRRHLAMVFVHEIDPSFGDQEHQTQLNEVHNVSPPAGGVVYKC